MGLGRERDVEIRKAPAFPPGEHVRSTRHVLGYIGEEHSLETPLTPADFAFQEERFKK